MSVLLNALLVMVMAVQIVISGILTVVGVSLITLQNRDRALDLVEKSQ